ncbi:MAG: hypothetical protein O3A46_08815 [Candidatus Poribacteria bacterium]|nr:hypothetical protein [Candidatus Poribacteria bacterium]
MNRHISLTLVIGVVLTLVGCDARPMPNATAISFLEWYVFARDLPKAAELAAGDARAKLQTEMNDASKTAASSRAPVSRTETEATRLGDARYRYAYDVEFRPKGGETTTGRFSMALERIDGEWKVVEFDLVAPEDASL